jgi:glycogen synthase
MRILFWSELFWPYLGGVELLAANFLTAMQARGHELAVITSHGHLELPEQDEYAGVPVHRFAFRAALAERDVTRWVELRRRLRELKDAFAPDLLHMYALGPSALFHLQTEARPSVPVLATLHGEVLRSHEKGHDTVLERILARARWVTGVSSAVLEAARQRTPAIRNRSSVIYTGLAQPRLQPEPLAHDEPRLLCLGRLVWDKGFDLALSAFVRLLKQFPRARLLVAGDGPVRADLERQAAELGVADAVEFHGWLAPDQVPALLNRVTMVLTPSRREGLPLVAIQAAQMRRPVVAARAGGLPEVVVHGETGLLVAPEDSGAVGDAMSYLLENPDVADRLGGNARIRAEMLFDHDRHFDAYDRQYRALVKVPWCPVSASSTS